MPTGTGTGSGTNPVTGPGVPAPPPPVVDPAPTPGGTGTGTRTRGGGTGPGTVIVGTTPIVKEDTTTTPSAATYLDSVEVVHQALVEVPLLTDPLQETLAATTRLYRRLDNRLAQIERMLG